LIVPRFKALHLRTDYASFRGTVEGEDWLWNQSCDLVSEANHEANFTRVNSMRPSKWKSRVEAAKRRTT
jgi:hypothetical protein